MEHPYGGVQYTTGYGGLELSLNRTDHFAPPCLPELQTTVLSSPMAESSHVLWWLQVAMRDPIESSHIQTGKSSFLLLYHRSKEPSFSEASVTLRFIFMWNNKCFNAIWLAFLCLNGKHLDNTCYFLCISTSHSLQHFNKRCVCTRFPYFTFNYTLKTK